MQEVVEFLLGAIMVMCGLFFFLQGVRIGLLPVGRLIGSALPSYGSVYVLLIGAFALGVVITVAEPDVRVLAYQVDMVSGGHISSMALVLSVAVGVGVFVALSMVRLFLNIPLTVLLTGGYLIVLTLSFFAPPHYVAVAFDAGGVTTGPMTVPFILALGLGTAAVLGRRTALSGGFGLVGLASIGPVIAVLLLGVVLG